MCVCKVGYYFPNTTAEKRFFNGTDLEEEYSKILEEGQESVYEDPSAYQCLKCAEGCDECEDSSPCIVSLNWVLRTILLILQCVIIGCLPVVVLFTYKYKDIKVVRAASPLLLRIIILGAFFIYSTTIVLYPTPNIVTCTLRIWLREIGFALAYGALMLKTWRISVIFRVRSAKAVKITDMDLIKRLGLIVGIFVLCLLIRTLVSPPIVIEALTSDDLKAFLCQSDWWDHSFTILEFLFLLWGIRLCIMVRKAPSEFNESRFISMTIYNEFLLSIFLNVSVFFLQQPANPDLLYIIFFCHSQLTISILLCLIFASKFYLVMKGHGKQDETLASKNGPGKFVASKVRAAHTSLSQASNVPTLAGIPSSAMLMPGGPTGGDSGRAMSDKDIQLELDRIFQTLQLLKERGSSCDSGQTSGQNSSTGGGGVQSKIAAIQEALRASTSVASVPAAPPSGSKTLTATPSPTPSARTPTTPQGPNCVKRASVQMVNGQIVNCQSSPLLEQPADTTVLATQAHEEEVMMNSQKLQQHDSPVIVHIPERNQTRVSFDFSNTAGPLLNPVSNPGECQANQSPTQAGQDTELPALEGSRVSSLSSHDSSCHSSRCCCSSYACSYCSPRGSIVMDSDTKPGASLTHEPDSGSPVSNSVEVASPPVQTDPMLTVKPVVDSREAWTQSKFIQTDQPPPPANHKTLNRGQAFNADNFSDISDDEEEAAEHPDSIHVAADTAPDDSNDNVCLPSPDPEKVPGNPGLKSGLYKKKKKKQTGSGKHDTRSGHAKTHRIVINLDDKNRFTDEVTV